MGDVVVDVSLAAKWVIREREGDEARAMLLRWHERGICRTGPSWFVCELGNNVCPRLLRGRTTPAGATASVDAVLARVVLLDVEPVLTKRALELADEAGRPASYDAQCLALADPLGRELWTADRRLWNSTRRTRSWVRWVGEDSAP